jgi:iron complex transport system ATP-binding protein
LTPHAMRGARFDSLTPSQRRPLGCAVSPFDPWPPDSTCSARMGSILEVNHLRIARGDTTILDDVSWRVDRGEHWAILGANGSGKTSLLKALTGYLSPTRGDLALLGRRYGTCDWRDLRLQIGVVMSAFAASIPPAEPALDTVVSGKFAQLDLWHPVTSADRATGLRLLRSSGLGGLARREWLYLSQGERQRVLIARALMARPRLLILDEPCAGLDPVARENFLRFVDQLATQNKSPTSRRPKSPALVLVTHHVEEITPAFTHALLLRDGRVLAAGPREQVLTSANLSATFGAPLRISRPGSRYRLHLAPA